jgi:hypothetical protein
MGGLAIGSAGSSDHRLASTVKVVRAYRAWEKGTVAFRRGSEAGDSSTWAWLGLQTVCFCREQRLGKR